MNDPDWRYTDTMRSMETYKVRALLDELLDAVDANAALRTLVLEADDERSEPFARYAGLVLRDAGIQALTEPEKPAIRIRHIADGQLVRLFTSSTPPGVTHQPLQTAEDALNRLLGVRDAIENGIGARKVPLADSPSSQLRERYARYGIEYPLWSDPTRGAHVQLPATSTTAMPTCAYYNEVDWRMLDNVASIAHLSFQSTILANKNQVIFSVKAPHGSEWDVRTRLASSLGNLWLSLHFSYRFDCDLSRGLATVRFTIPPTESFPSYVPSRQANMLEPVGSRIGDARIVYALRLAVLIAATCFGAGRSVEHAFIRGTDAHSDLTISCEFERDAFVRNTLPAVDTGRVADSSLRFDVDGVIRAIAPLRSGHSKSSAQLMPESTTTHARIASIDDARVLPDGLQRLFHAKRVCDIDVSHRPGGAERILDEALDDAQRYTASAIASLEELVNKLEASLEPPDNQPDARPLHCENALRRLAIALLDEELNIGADAEAFLNFDEENPSTLPDVYYYRAPSALLAAHAGLADLYQILGDHRAAEQQANRCIALAPTTPAGYAIKAKTLSKQKRPQEAMNVILEGLRCSLADDDRSFLLHNLALLLRSIGKQRESEALLLYASSLSGLYAGKSLEIVKGIAEGVNVNAFIHANLPHATQMVDEMGIATDIGRTRNVLISHATLGLVNAHAPNAAAPYAALLAKQFPTNRAIISACNSIQQGIA